jgi:hypothetical protein
VIIIYNIIVFGTGSTCRRLLDNMNEDINVLAFADNNSDKWNEYCKGKKIISPNKINAYKYDFIAIASQFEEDIYLQLLEMNIKREVIFQYIKFLDLSWNPFEYKIQLFKKDIDKIKTIITGISYSLCGVLDKKLEKIGLNFSLESQDLFYDYQIFKFILRNYNNKLKYGIIGICYYSFQYDMSLSAMRNKVINYYHTLKNSHNFMIDIDFNEELKVNRYIADILLRKDQLGYWDFGADSQSLSNLENKELMGKNQTYLDCNKNYPKTVKENIQIFKDYLQLLKEHSIKPIVVVFPTSKYYTKYFSKRIEDEFHSIIRDVKSEYDFQYIDYFRSDLFNEDEFWDVSHLNSKGAEKFTEILNKEIKW